MGADKTSRGDERSLRTLALVFRYARVIFNNAWPSHRKISLLMTVQQCPIFFWSTPIDSGNPGDPDVLYLFSGPSLLALLCSDPPYEIQYDR